ncbi:hypothetical protein FRC04_006026 [Tulasnella sp. 424]|nr:hypothetical protein FRC04_006026 [Tulasnella sp. 424]
MDGIEDSGELGGAHTRSGLWAHIVAGLSIPGVETCLVGSLGHWQPLYIYLDAAKYTDKREGMPKDRSDWERTTKVRRAYEIAYVDRVLPHISRVRVASLKISTETYVFLEAMLTSPAPLLDELKVERTDMDLGPFPVPAAPPAEAFCGHAPSLKKLDIGRGFHSLINSFKFSGLSSLSILSEETLAMDKIIDMLAESPGMSSLTIVEGRTDRGFNPFLTNGQANDADHNRNPQHTVLRKLTLRLEGTDRVLYLLEHVQAPSCTQLDLRHGTADPPLHFVRRSLDPFLPAFQQARASMVWMRRKRPIGLHTDIR